MKKRSLVVASVQLVAVAVTLGAQQMPATTTDRLIRLGFAGGVVVPRTGATVQSLKTGMQGLGFVLLQLPGGLPALRFNFDYAKMDFDRPTTNTSTATPTGDRTVVDGVAGMKVDLIRGPIRPYIMAGLGAFNVKDAIAATATTGATSTSALNVGVDGGAGIALKLGPIDGFIETRLQNVWTKQGGAWI